MVSLNIMVNISILSTNKQEKMTEDFTAKNQTQEQLSLILTQRSFIHTTPVSHTAFKSVTHSFAKVLKKMHGHTHCMNTCTHIRAVANVCLSVCLALRRAMLIAVKQYMELCCTVCGRMYSVFVLSVL